MLFCSVLDIAIVMLLWKGYNILVISGLMNLYMLEWKHNFRVCFSLYKVLRYFI